ncbi:MAG: coenzyme F420-0:L-glutamate ligase [Actinomycetota bacterium]|nr:coenzyme F420-0:L-glutamate ligase [Actinomycetota bacterium]
MHGLTIAPVVGIPEISPGDDIGEAIYSAAGSSAFGDNDVVVVTQKIVSKAEGRLVPARDRAEAIAAESARVLRKVGDMTISETRHGFVCANAGVDASNIEGDDIALLPKDPDASARRVRARLEHLTGRTLGVIISDTFGRAWRIGQTDVAIGIAGIDPFIDYRGSTDVQGRELQATSICIADELAGAAEIVMGKAQQIAAAIIRGAPVRFANASIRLVVRHPSGDLFR